MSAPVTIAVVGIHGFGGHHLAELAGLREIASLVAVVDPRGADGVADIPEGTPCYASLAELLAQDVPDVVVLATPIHTHAPLAIEALRAGAHVLLEKPTAASIVELTELVAVGRETGRAVQVGFQSLGSHALPAIERLLADGAIGEVTGFGGLGTWRRDVAYYQRSRWAGMRELDGVPVVDGVTTNPLSHSIATALHVAGAHRAEDVASVEVELYRAHDIEADDTSSVRVTTADGRVLAFGLTLTSPQMDTAPLVTVHGTRGRLELEYTRDVVRVLDAEGGVTEERFGRQSVLRNLLEHVADPAVPLLVPAERTGAFMRVLDAVRSAPAPTPVDPAYVTWLGEGLHRHPVIEDIERWCARVEREQKLFSELGAPWAAPRPS